MEIRLAKIYSASLTRDTKIAFLDVITESQFNVLINYLNQLEDLNNIERLSNFAIINENEISVFLIDSSNDLRNKHITWNSIKREDLNEIYLNTNRLLLNYLSSIRTFLDHSAHFISQAMGKDSDRFSEYNKMTNYFFDNSFAYRFLYKLRNYAQHISLPIENIEIETVYQNSISSIKFELMVNFNSNVLLSRFDWGKDVKKDLENGPASIPLMPILIEMRHNIQEIKRNIITLYSDELCNAAKFILESIQHVINDDGEIFIAYNVQNNERGELTNFQNISIPFEAIKYIQKELLK